MEGKKKISNYRKLIVPAIEVLVALTAIFAGIFFLTEDKEPVVQYLHASWGEGYAGIEDLTEKSDLIALVRIAGLDREKEEDVPGSYFRTEITEGVKGCETGDEIILFMSGIKNERIHMEMEDNPLVKIGGEYLIFARRNTTGTYVVLGGPQGRFVLEDGKLTAQTYLNKERNVRVQAAEPDSPATPEFLQIHDMDAEQMLQEIRGYLSE